MQNNQYLKKFVEETTSLGWDEAFYNYIKEKVLKGQLPEEDLRITDWHNYVPFNSRQTALLFGCGLGIEAVKLCEIYKKIYVFDIDVDKMLLLEALKKARALKNIYFIHIDKNFDLPFQTNYFDLIVFRDVSKFNQSFIEIIRRLYMVLNKDGTLYLNVANRTSFVKFLGKVDKGNFSAHTLPGYRRILNYAGFSQIKTYAPLPYYDGIPLFYLPLENNQIAEFFLNNVFPLFDMVSPEVKKQYGLQYILAKAGVKIGTNLKLDWVLKYFVHGFSILSVK